MADSTEKIVVEISAKTDQINAQLKTLTAQLDDMGNRAKKSTSDAAEGFQKIGTAIKAYISFESLKKITTLTADAELASNKLAAQVSKTGAQFGVSAQELERYARVMEGKTLFDADQFKGAEEVLMTFRSTTGKNFEDMIKLSTDLAARMGTDVPTAARILGSAMERPDMATRSLKEAGVLLTGQEQVNIAVMMKHGEVAEAQALIYNKLQDAVGGFSDKVAVGLPKLLHDISSAFSDAAKSIGGFLLAIGFDDVLEGIKKFGQAASEVFDALAGAILGVRIEFNELIGNEKTAAELQDRLIALQDKYTKGTDKLATSTKQASTNTKELTRDQAQLAYEFREHVNKSVEELLTSQDQIMNTDLQDRLHKVDILWIQNADAVKALGDKADALKVKLKNAIAIDYQADQMKKAWHDIGQAITSGLDTVDNAFEQMLEHGKFSFSGLVDAAKQAAAQIATAMIIKPAMASLFGSLLSGAGFANLGSQVAGTGPNMLSILGSGANSIAGLLGLPSFSMTGAGGVGAAINGFGSSTFGISGLSGILGAGGIGAGIGGLTTLLTGGNAVGGSIGGGIGGMIGSAILPGIGTLIGSGLGGLIGGMFGGGKKHPAASFATTLDDNGGFGNYSNLSDNMSGDFSQNLANIIQPITQTLSQAGVGIAGQFINAGVNQGQGFLQLGGSRSGGGKQFTFDPNDAKAMDDALKAFEIELTKTGNITNQKVVTALKNLQTDGKGAADVLNQIADAAGLATADNVAKWQKTQADFTSTLNDVIKNANDLANKFLQVAAQLDKTLQSFLIGNLSALSPQEQYDLAKQTFESVSAQAQGGNLAALSELSDAAKTFLEQSQQFNASNMQYKSDFGEVTDALKAAMGSANSQAANQQLIAQTAQGQLNSINANPISSNDQNSSIIAQLAIMNNNLNQQNTIIKSIISDPLRRTG